MNATQYMEAVRLAIKAENGIADLVSFLDSCGDTRGDDAQRAVESLRALRKQIARELHAYPATPEKAGTHWTDEDDDYLAAHWGPALRDARGDTEAAIAGLAVKLQRTPVAVAMRLCTQGVLEAARKQKLGVTLDTLLQRHLP